MPLHSRINLQLNAITPFVQMVTDGLVAAWDMEETSGCRRDEVGGEDFHTQHWYQSVSSAAGLSGQAADLTDNANEMLGAMLTKNSPIGRTSWSFSYWVKFTTFTGGPRIPAPWGYLSVGANVIWEYVSAASSITYTTSLATWYQYTFTYNISTDKYLIYINGVNQTGSGLTPVSANKTADVKLVFGHDSYPPLAYFDMARLYNKVLSQSEIDALYNNGLGTPYRLAALPAYQETFKAPVAVVNDGVQAIIEALEPAATYNVPDGVHGVTGTLAIPAGVTVQAASGARPIFVRTDGYAPRCTIGDGTTVDGLWIGGAIGSDYETPDQSITTGSTGGCTIKNCVFWGHYDSFSESGTTSTPNLFENNRWVSCGGLNNWHSIYVTAQPVGAGSTFQNNIFVGGNGGYHMHLFHGPQNLTIQKNLLADASVGAIAISGQGHTITKNLLWSSRYGHPMIQKLFANDDQDPAQPPTQTYTYNLHYGFWDSSTPQGVTAPPVTTNNYFARNSYAAFGTFSTVWTEAQMEAAVTITATTINAAIDNIRRAFFGTPAEIYANTNIEGWFTTLEGLITTWDTASEIPIAPSGLTAEADGSDTINLTWVDNSNNETGFEIYRSLTDSNYVLLDDVAADEESYSDTTCEAETKYYYKVLATGTGGDSALSSSASATTEAEVAGWWLSGGVDAGKCIAAYQPKGAADLADSYDNLTGNSDYDAAPGTAPTWNVTDGWIFNGTTQKLVTGAYPASAWSLIARYTVPAYVSADICGSTDGSDRALSLAPFTNVFGSTYWNQGSYAGAVILESSSGVIGCTGQLGYFNGTAETSSIDAWSGGASNAQIMIGGRAADVYRACTIQALAIYNCEITAEQIATISTAMAAL